MKMLVQSTDSLGLLLTVIGGTTSITWNNRLEPRDNRTEPGDNLAELEDNVHQPVTFPVKLSMGLID